MNDAYLAAIAGVAGSVIGAVSMLGTSWFSQRTQERADRHLRAMSKRQQLYEDFIEEASKLYADAMTHDLGDPSKLVHLYALVGKLRLFAPVRILAKADEILRCIIQLYQTPGKAFDLSQALQRPDDLDLLRAFSDACRDDLHHSARAPHKSAGHLAAAAADLSMTHGFGAGSPPGRGGPRSDSIPPKPLPY